jgi:molybdopterin-biosynthesis enzyme MoeA-like protein
MAKGFGLIIIGDEILSGHREDKHLSHAIELLAEWGHQPKWVRMLGDDRNLLRETFVQTLASEDLVFSFGGIGATADDMTRPTLAEAAGVDLMRHAQAVAEIEAQFGEAAYPQRVLMADWPQGSDLIPNPVNRVAGFRFKNHHCLPGFPQMAWPMMRWCLETWYDDVRQAPESVYALKLVKTSESQIVDYMQSFSLSHPQVKLYSLPHMQGAERMVEFGMKGNKNDINQLVGCFLEGISNLGIDISTAQRITKNL